MNPYRHRNELSAQDLINCGFEECHRIERKVKEELLNKER